MTKRDLIFSVFEELKISSDDTDITEEYVSSLADKARMFLVKQMYANKSWNIPVELKQQIRVALENVPSIDGLDCFGTILRSVDALPRSLSPKGQESILAVRRTDKIALPLDRVPMERLPFVGHGQFIAQMVYAALDADGKLYLVSNQKKINLLEQVIVEIVAEAPDDAQLVAYRETVAGAIPAAPVEPWDEEYPVEVSMGLEIVDMIVKRLRRTIELPEDKLNDATDERK